MALTHKTARAVRAALTAVKSRACNVPDAIQRVNFYVALSMDLLKEAKTFAGSEARKEQHATVQEK